jgi:hypothetical protein
MMPRLEAGEMLDALHVQALAIAPADSAAKQEKVAKLQARARGEAIAPEKPRKASVNDLAGMGIGIAAEIVRDV